MCQCDSSIAAQYIESCNLIRNKHEGMEGEPQKIPVKVECTKTITLLNVGHE
jgi:hypothetical protein